MSRNTKQDYLLDDHSSDLILILMLKKHAERIEANPPGGVKGRPPRIRRIATRYG
jgi:hypothetical protein